jgi:dolichol-phosphate mannosyltransferase
MTPEVSIIVPFFNEEENVVPLLTEVRRVCDGIGNAYEGIFVNDGSQDGTGRKLDQVTEGWPQAKTFHFLSNYGQAAALFFGMKQAAGEVLVTLDGDGQNDPADIPKLLAELTDCDMVAGESVHAGRTPGLAAPECASRAPCSAAPSPLAAAFSVAGAPRNPKKPVFEV